MRARQKLCWTCALLRRTSSTGATNASLSWDGGMCTQASGHKLGCNWAASSCRTSSTT
uniref:Uncharacterized protein n=1 Tax=Setaria viridis TaxID=4556 RepID=A0A4U6VZZ7_SETVI|nr:hypothetical protein SEVIR_2G256066v2 [Setaria viridis]